MFSKTLFTTLTLLMLTATSALAAPPLSCPAASTVTVVASSSSAAASNVAVASSSVVSSAVATATASNKGGKDKDGKHGKGGKHRGGGKKGDDTSSIASSTDVDSASSSNIAVSTSAVGSSASTSNVASSTSTSTAGGSGKGGAKDAGGSGLSAIASGTSADSSASATAPPSSSTSGSSTSGDDQQSATTLNPSVIATGFALDGQQVPAEGQVASLTSKNNFINFCLTVNKPITNGQQIKTGSCNPAPMGVIAATTNMPSSKFQFPKNGDTIKANQEFTVQMAISNLEAGNFVNAASNYYSAPQQVNAQGNIIGHSHVVIEKLDSLNQTTPTDPNKFAFFKGINGAAVNGVITADVTDGLPAGSYRMASINAAANHQPVLVAVAQHGSLDDMVYFTVQ